MPKQPPPLIKNIHKYIVNSKIKILEGITISHSQLSMFSQCPHKWSLNYKDGFKLPSFSINMTFGTAMHNTIQNYLDVLYNVSGVKADEIDLEEYFEKELKTKYLEELNKNSNVHFSNKEEINEYYNDGIEILNFLKKNRKKYFSSRGYWLAGCEIPISFIPNEKYPNITYIGYIDMAIYHENTNTLKIFDFKTSIRSWDDKQKKDEIKQAQLLLYKHAISKQFNIPEGNIEIEFFILKRKLFENSDYPQKRIQLFSPSSGKIKVGKALKSVNDFIENSFSENGFKDKQHEAKPSKWSCQFCVFKEKKHLCKVGIS
jgi:hypothetical protein